MDLTSRLRAIVRPANGGANSGANSGNDATTSGGSRELTYEPAGGFESTINLARVDEEELTELIEDAWRMTAPKRVVKAFDER